MKKSKNARSRDRWRAQTRKPKTKTISRLVYPGWGARVRAFKDGEPTPILFIPS